MAQLRCMVTLPYVSGVPGDVAQNNLHWADLSANYTDYDDLGILIANFYNAGTLGNSIAENLSPIISRETEACSVTFYDLADTPPRTPRWVHRFTIEEANFPESGIPLEVAVCMSFKAAPVEGVAAASLRNRIYIGPLTPHWFSEDAEGYPVVSSEGQDAIHTAGRLLLTETGVDGQWQVHSPTLGLMFPVQSGWIDNEWDTQRRRGRTATSRNVFTASA